MGGRRWLRVTELGAVAVGALLVVIGIGPLSGEAQAQTSSSTVTTTLASGTTTNANGLDPNTSLCQNPAGVTSILGPDPTTPVCQASTPSNPIPSNPYVVVANTTLWGSSSCGFVWGCSHIAGATWVGIASTGSDSSNAPSATLNPFYIYDAEFPLSCPAGASLQGSMAADNAVGVFLNGNFLTATSQSAITSNFSTPTPFGSTSGFQATNTIDFIVNDISPSYTGLDYGVTITDNLAACATPPTTVPPTTVPPTTPTSVPTTTAATVVVPTSAQLAFTGGPSLWVIGAGGALTASGATMLVVGRRRRPSRLAPASERNR
jgi:hypothetical protein